MRGKQFIEEMFIKPLTAASEKITAASEKIANHQIAMEGNTGIGTIKGINYAYGRGKQAAGKEFAKNMESRRYNILDKRVNNENASKWATDLLMADGAKGNVASLFFSGETGNLSKTRIAGVAAGLGFGAHHVLSSDDR